MRSGVSEGVPQAMVEAAMMGGLVDGMPFILDDDGAYDLDLNRFFRACPTMGVRSMHSVKAYARDILTWLRFLKERRGGKTMWQAGREDVAALSCGAPALGDSALHLGRVLEPQYRGS